MKERLTYWIVFIIILIEVSCANKTQEDKKGQEADTQTPVTVARVNTQPLVEFIELNATSSFLQKSFVNASINGYVQTVRVEPGQYVASGQTLFTLITKEAKNIGNVINSLDTNFKFTGITHIKAEQKGFVKQLHHQKGDYVQDGEPLATIYDENSFAFLMDVPYELNNLLKRNRTVEVILPDRENLQGIVISSMPVVDSASQTQRVIVKVKSAHSIPEGLVATVRLVKNVSKNAVSLPASCVLTSETEDEFWVMKLINDTLAVKTVVKKGTEADGRIAILSPSFSSNDKFVLSGGYGLPDTAKVKILKQ